MACDEREYQIAPGHDAAYYLGIWVEIEVAGGYPALFQPPLVFPGYDAGAVQTRGDGRVYLAGFPSVRWVISVMSREGHYYLRQTYCTEGGVVGYSGLVTVRTDLGDAGTFANYNATMVLPKEADTDYRLRQLFDYPIVFTRLVAI